MTNRKSWMKISLFAVLVFSSVCRAQVPDVSMVSDLKVQSKDVILKSDFAISRESESLDQSSFQQSSLTVARVQNAEAQHAVFRSKAPAERSEIKFDHVDQYAITEFSRWYEEPASISSFFVEAAKDSTSSSTGKSKKEESSGAAIVASVLLGSVAAVIMFKNGAKAQANGDSFWSGVGEMAPIGIGAVLIPIILSGSDDSGPRRQTKRGSN